MYRNLKFLICSCGPYFDVMKKRAVLWVPGNFNNVSGGGSEYLVSVKGGGAIDQFCTFLCAV
jgi:hypothetical protein